MGADAADADRSAAIALANQTVGLLTDAVARPDRAETALGAKRHRAEEAQAKAEWAEDGPKATERPPVRIRGQARSEESGRHRNKGLKLADLSR